MTDRLPGAPGRCKAVVTGEELQKMQTGEEFSITLRRDDQPIKEGTPYSKAAVLPDAVAAKLCPGVQDPTPGDAFGALQSQKADTIRKAIGSNITIPDAAYTPLKGLTLYCSGGDVEVKVMGKNLLPLNDITFNGVYSFTLEKPIPAGQYKFYTSGITSTNTSNTFRIGFYSNGAEIQALQVQKIAGETNLSVVSPVDKIYLYGGTSYSNAQGHDTTWKDMMISVDGGEYEPYKEPQTLAVSVPDGFENTGFVCKDVAKLHTYMPSTTIINDAGAIMEVTYYTSSTAVQMVHSPADKDKLFSIDEHGCAILVNRESVTQKVMTRLEDLMYDVENLIRSDEMLNDALESHAKDTNNPHAVIAEQLGIADYIVEQNDYEALKWRIWASGLGECWGEMTVSASGSPGNTEHCNLFSDLPLYFAHFDSVQVTVLSNDPSDPGDSQYADTISNLLMSVFNIDAEAERERLVVRFGMISAGSYNLLAQDVSQVRLSIRVSGTVH